MKPILCDDEMIWLVNITFCIWDDNMWKKHNINNVKQIITIAFSSEKDFVTRIQRRDL